ncbi:MAG: site-specific DNA-methyltransferase [Prevotellaceae bacterium]|jgi:DNA modification methylase|nr:site-specific DNA-methyltransferase [Prevotellaceae bacterium]
MGAGTTALVAKQSGRNYIGIELNENYVKLAEDRINKANN